MRSSHRTRRWMYFPVTLWPGTACEALMAVSDGKTHNLPFCLLSRLIGPRQAARSRHSMWVCVCVFVCVKRGAGRGGGMSYPQWNPLYSPEQALWHIPSLSSAIPMKIESGKNSYLPNTMMWIKCGQALGRCICQHTQFFGFYGVLFSSPFGSVRCLAQWEPN